jgi:heme/copper-type cytochrome/quinol oxidase subunit 1
VLSANPFGRGYPCRIGKIHRYHAVVGANGTTMVMVFAGRATQQRRMDSVLLL